MKTVNLSDKAFAGWDLYDLGETAFVNKGHLGFEATHSHDTDGKDIYAKGMYFYVVTLDVNNGSEIILPSDNELLILSACEVNSPKASLVTPLMDEVPEREFTFHKNLKEKLRYLQSNLLWKIKYNDD